MRLRNLLAPLVCLAVTMAGCARRDDAPADPSPSGDDQDGTFAIAELFAAVPDDPELLALVVATDYERAAEAVGVEIPPADAARDDPAVETWFRSVLMPSQGAGATPVAFADQPAELDAWRTEVGFSVLDTTASAEFGAAPEQLFVYAVTVDAATIDTAVRSDPQWSAELVDAEAHGVPYYFWSGDGKPDLDRVSPVRPLGRGGTMAVRDGLVLRAVMDHTMQAALGADTGATLADHPDVATLLSAFARHRPYNLGVTNKVFDAEPGRASGVSALLPPTRLLATGQAMSNGTRQLLLGYVFGDEEAATEAARRLDTNLRDGSSARTGEKWSTMFGSWTIEVDGRAVVAVIDQPEPTSGFWANLLFSGETLFYSARAEVAGA